MINTKLIHNMEYCTIERAAKILECEIEDIEHFLTIGAVGAYVFMRGFESSSDLVLGTKLMFMSAGELVTLIDESISTEMSAASITEINHNLSPTCHIQAEIEGLWRIVDLATTVNLLYGDEEIDARLRPANRDGELIYEQKLAMIDSDSFYVYGFNAPTLVRSDLRIIGSDLRKLYSSLYGEGEELANVHNNDQLRQQANADKKNESKQSTSSDLSKLKAIGALASILAKKHPAYQHGSKPNAKKISELIDQELELLGISVSKEIRKDISKGYELIIQDIT
jgi:hypothetical protein